MQKAMIKGATYGIAAIVISGVLGKYIPSLSI